MSRNLLKLPAVLTLTHSQQEVIEWLLALPRAQSVSVSTSLTITKDGRTVSPSIRISGGNNEGDGNECKACKHVHYNEPWCHVVFEWDGHGFNHAEIHTHARGRTRNRIPSIREAKARVESASRPRKIEKEPF